MPSSELHLSVESPLAAAGSHEAIKAGYEDYEVITVFESDT
jgi:hypothetical protein